MTATWTRAILRGLWRQSRWWMDRETAFDEVKDVLWALPTLEREGLLEPWRNCFAYDCGTMCRGQWWWYREYDAALGPPSGPARRGAYGVWQRDFEGGFVVVNGTGAPAVVDLPVTLRDVTSGNAADRVELQGFDGRLFEKAGSP